MLNFLSTTGLRFLMVICGLLLLSSCFKHDEPNYKGALITWDANRESLVNSTGGGYKVYYSTQSGFDPLTEGTMINVPYMGGSLTSTKALIHSVPAGTYYFRVMAYSRLGTSNFSPEQSVVIPAF